MKEPSFIVGEMLKLKATATKSGACIVWFHLYPRSDVIEIGTWNPKVGEVMIDVCTSVGMLSNIMTNAVLEEFEESNNLNSPKRCAMRRTISRSIALSLCRRKHIIGRWCAKYQQLMWKDYLSLSKTKYGEEQWKRRGVRAIMNTPLSLSVEVLKALLHDEPIEPILKEWGFKNPARWLNKWPLKKRFVMHSLSYCPKNWWSAALLTGMRFRQYDERSIYLFMNASLKDIKYLCREAGESSYRSFNIFAACIWLENGIGVIHHNDTLKSLVRRSIKWHEDILKQNKGEDFPLYPDGLPPILANLDDNWYIPSTAHELYDVGIQQHNCVSSYAVKVCHGQSYIICHLDKDEIIATLEIDPESLDVIQCRGKFNKAMPNSMMAWKRIIFKKKRR